ncbi:sigma 54 modulation/S30EA ribosomal C-terminal domain-containing protein, partial [Akkermansiaceae bacterium]|nr:sigma 54 modulation/S30EA ribosomal C-terminal domain-containing protein [Akkermansiaceae bacterium]
ETIDKIARRMRKHKTRLLKRHRPKADESIKYFNESSYKADFLDNLPEEVEEEPEPFYVHKEQFRLRKLYKEEAIMELDLTERPFVVFDNARRGVTSIVWRKEGGDYGMVDVS